MTNDLPVPHASRETLRELDAEGMLKWGHPEAPDDVADQWANEVARPIVVAELLALAGKALNLPAPDGVDPDGFDAARWAFREMIAERCDELGVKVEEL